MPQPLKWAVPEPHPDHDPTGARQQNCHPGEKIPQRQVIKNDGVWEQKNSVCHLVKEVSQKWSVNDADGEEMQSVNFAPASPGYIHCSAENYNGSFVCSWTRTRVRSTARVLLVKAKR